MTCDCTTCRHWDGLECELNSAQCDGLSECAGWEPGRRRVCEKPEPFTAEELHIMALRERSAEARVTYLVASHAYKNARAAYLADHP
ncbi:MAG: hypothetical protein WC093_07700, partial [Methanoculleus sp.]